MNYDLVWPEPLLNRIGELGLSAEGEFSLVEQIDRNLRTSNISEVCNIRPIEIHLGEASVFVSIAAKQVDGRVLINFWELSVIWP